MNSGSAQSGTVKEDRVRAHILVCFLANPLWKTLVQWMKASGLSVAPRTRVEEFARIKSADVVLAAHRPDGRHPITFRLRRVTTPDAGQDVLLNHLGLTPPHRLRRIDEAPSNLPVGVPMSH